MKTVNIKIKEARVAEFYTKTFLITLEIIYDCNGQEKKLVKDTFLRNLEVFIPELIKEIREKEKQENDNDEGDHILDGFTIVNMGDTEVVENKLGHFLGKVKDSMNAIKQHGSATGYLNKVSSIRGMEVKLNVR